MFKLLLNESNTYYGCWRTLSLKVSKQPKPIKVAFFLHCKDKYVVYNMSLDVGEIMLTLKTVIA